MKYEAEDQGHANKAVYLTNDKGVAKAVYWKLNGEDTWRVDAMDGCVGHHDETPLRCKTRARAKFIAHLCYHEAITGERGGYG